MKQTEQYQLSQWEQEDRILREDFNANNAKVDAALKAVAEQVLGSPRLVSGTYSGTGENVSVHYSLGMQPSLLLLATNNSLSSGSYNRFLIASDSFCLNFNSSGSLSFLTNFVSFDEDGFTLNHGIMYVNQGYNASETTQTYWALC